MPNRQLVRRLLLAAVWAFAVSTWAAIGHYLAGLPDFGAVPPLLVAAAILAAPWLPMRMRQTRLPQAAGTPGSTENG
jgi:hypothetical protein